MKKKVWICVLAGLLMLPLGTIITLAVSSSNSSYAEENEIVVCNGSGIKRSGKYYPLLERYYAEHLAIYTAIVGQKPLEAEQAVIIHTRNSRDVLNT